MLLEVLSLFLSNKACLNLLISTDHFELMISFHVVFFTQVNFSPPVNSIKSTYRARVHCEHLTILNYKE